MLIRLDILEDIVEIATKLREWLRLDFNYFGIMKLINLVDFYTLSNQ